MFNIIPYQNCLKVGTDKPKLKARAQSVSDDNLWRKLPEKLRFELTAKVFSEN